MNLKEKTLILFLILFNLGYSQKKRPNFIGENLNSVENNVDWKILERATGILNKDRINDYAIILESIDSIFEKDCFDCKPYKHKPRIIIVLLSQNGENKVVIQNNKFIEDSSDEWYPNFRPSLDIKDGLLRVYYQYTRSNDLFSFELEKQKLKITYAKSYAMDSGSGEYTTSKFDFKKKETIYIKGSIRTGDEDDEIITKLDIKQKHLSELGEMKLWEIIRD